MDRSPRALARWLRPLALLLVIEGVISVVFALPVSNPEIYWGMVRTLIHLPHVALLIGFGVGIRILTSGGEFRAAAQRLLWVGLVSIGATELARFQDIYVWSTISRPSLLFHALGSVLLGVAGPGIWGTALAREADLQNPAISLAGRIHAFTSVAGFGSYVVAESVRLMDLWTPGSPNAASAADVAFTLILGAARGSLLWSTILFWRAPADEISARSLAQKVQLLMLVWLVAGSAALILSAAVGVISPGIGMAHKS